MSNYYLLLLLSLLNCLLSISSADDTSTITLALTRAAPPSTSNNPLENLKYQAAASLERAQRLKYPKNDDVINTKVYPQKGFYSVHLSFGTPPQALRFGMDTGSHLTWFPCTQNYACTDCDVPGVETPQIFIPENSSSYKSLPCNSPQCTWLSPESQCNNKKNICEYIILYGIGNTTGQLVSENLTLPAPGGGEGLSVNNFIVGCSVSSDNAAEGGILGLGRGRVSLPAQMGLKSFSYCMVSHEYDENPNATSDLVLTTTKGGVKNNNKVHYTTFANNPNIPSFLELLDLYYIGLQSISVGEVNVRVPAQYLEPDAYNGSGGTVVDSGTTFTFMEKPVFDLLINEFQKQVIGNKLYKRDKRAENKTGLELCYGVGRRKNKPSIKLPPLTFTFQGGAKMVLPLANYFAYTDEQRSVLCMTIVNGGDVGPGPAIIIGNYQQQNYYMEYDLANNRLGILQQKCY